MPDVVWVALFGALFGAAELVPRYRDAPLRALKTWSAGLYLLVNAAASIAALELIKGFGWTFGIESTETETIELVRVLVAGFAAMALFRSSLFITKVGDQDVAVGPVTVLQAALDAADRGVDRSRAERRVSEVKRAMSGVTVDQAVNELSALALNLMQNVSNVDKAQLAEAAAEIAESDLDDATKTYVLGLALMRLTGMDVLDAAKELLAQPQGG